MCLPLFHCSSAVTSESTVSMIGMGLESHAVFWLYQTFIPASVSTAVEWEAHTHKDRGSKLSKVRFSTYEWKTNRTNFQLCCPPSILLDKSMKWASGFILIHCVWNGKQGVAEVWVGCSLFCGAPSRLVKIKVRQRGTQVSYRIPCCFSYKEGEHWTLVTWQCREWKAEC